MPIKGPRPQSIPLDQYLPPAHPGKNRVGEAEMIALINAVVIEPEEIMAKLPCLYGYGTYISQFRCDNQAVSLQGKAPALFYSHTAAQMGQGTDSNAALADVHRVLKFRDRIVPGEQPGGGIRPFQQTHPQLGEQIRYGSAVMQDGVLPLEAECQSYAAKAVPFPDPLPGKEAVAAQTNLFYHAGMIITRTGIAPRQKDGSRKHAIGQNYIFLSHSTISKPVLVEIEPSVYHEVLYIVKNQVTM